MKAKIKKMNVYPVTVDDAVFLSGTNKTLKERLVELGGDETSGDIYNYKCYELPFKSKYNSKASLVIEGDTIVENSQFQHSKISINDFESVELKKWDRLNCIEGYVSQTKEVLLKTIAFTYNSETEGYYKFHAGLPFGDIDKPLSNSAYADILCTHFSVAPKDDFGKVNSVSLDTNKLLCLTIPKKYLDALTGDSPLNKFKNWLETNNPKMIYKSNIITKDITKKYTFDIVENTDINFNIITNYCKPSYVGVQCINEIEKNEIKNDIIKENVNQNPLYINTPCGYNQPYHPTVLYIPEGFGGYKFWMCQTAFPIGAAPYRDRWENPTIYCSNNGYDWEYPKGIVNPIDELTEAEVSNTDYFSDPHLVYRSDTKTLEVYYRITHVDLTQEFRKDMYPTWILRKKSNNGVNWTERETIINLQEPKTNGVGDMVRSHAIIYQDGKYKMWYVNMLPGQSPRTLLYAESLDGATWNNKTYCNTSKYIEPWHIDVHFSNGKYHMINYNQENSYLSYYISNDGFNFTYVKDILKPNGNPLSFYNNRFYRSCAIFAENKYYMYFTAETLTEAKIGLAIGDTMESLEVVQGNCFKGKQHFEGGLDLVNTKIIKNEIQLTDKGTCLGVDYETERVYIKKSDGTKIYIE